MTMKISVGGENFDSLIESGSYYVDKTELLYELVDGADNAVTLFTRPRRFGKTLVMSMMESFFDLTRDSRKIFSGLAVARHDEFCDKWMNRYPVLFVSLKDVTGLEFESAFAKLRATIADVCKRLPQLAQSPDVDAADKEIFERLRFQTASAVEVQYSLKTIMRMMNAVYGRPVILLIDEYDVPLARAGERKAAMPEYYAQMLEVIRGLLSTALKTNKYLKFAVVTGCLRIAKESIFTGVNLFKSYSVLDQRFSRYFGFTDAEVRALLEKAGLAGKFSCARDWYDGYMIGNTHVFCPWDVVNYVSDALENPDLQPKNYWKNTSGNGILRAFVERDDIDVTDKFETLLNGGSIRQVISDALTYDTLRESEDNLWSVLLMTGYLTKAVPDTGGGAVELKIPNREIASIFEDTVVRLFSDTIDRGEQQILMQALWNGDEAVASKAFSRLLFQTISYLDYHEDYYHAFLAGIFSGLGYAVESNREHGLGRPDLLLKDKRNRRAIVMEVKRSRSRGGMERDCEEALRQIAEKEYAGRLEDGYEQVMCYGVAFFQKSALVKGAPRLLINPNAYENLP